MKLITLFLACSCAIVAISCQKNKQEAPVTNSGTVRVQLKLAGDILTSETPLGRRSNDNVSANAKSYGNNTLYAVGMRLQSSTEPLYTGLFTHPDSMYIDIPASGQYNVSVHVYKKGTGGGLSYMLEEGVKYFGYPIGTLLKNRMDSVVRFPYMLDQVAFTQMADPLDPDGDLSNVEYPEVEYYQGDVNFTGAPNPAPIYIDAKRRSFGIRFGATNFTEGELLFEFVHPEHPGSPVLIPIRVTPANINSKLHIIASDDFRTSDSTKLITVRVIRVSPNGHQLIASKDIYFKRNVLTKLNLPFPVNGRTNIVPLISETDWSGNELIDF